MFLYPNDEGYFRCPVGLTLIMTILAKEGHEVKLFDTTFMAVGDNLDSKLREKHRTAKPIPMDHLFNKHSTKELRSKWIKARNYNRTRKGQMSDTCYYRRWANRACRRKIIKR